MRVGRRISVTALNANIDADLDLGAGHFLASQGMRGQAGLIQYIRHVVTDQYLVLMGGTPAPGAGARLFLNGSTHASAGDAAFEVPNTALNGDVPAMTIRHGDAPYADMLSHRVAAVLDPTTAQDALTYKVWAAWGATWTWSVAPAAPATISRSVRIGRTVFFYADYYSADSNAGVLQTVTLPVTAAIASLSQAIIAEVNNGAAGTFVKIEGRIESAAPTLITLANFPATTDGQAIYVRLAGFYEV